MKDNTTPLILAAAGGHTGCVLELIDQGADVNAKRVVREFSTSFQLSSF